MCMIIINMHIYYDDIKKMIIIRNYLCIRLSDKQKRVEYIFFFFKKELGNSLNQQQTLRPSPQPPCIRPHLPPESSCTQPRSWA